MSGSSPPSWTILIPTSSSLHSCEEREKEKERESQQRKLTTHSCAIPPPRTHLQQLIPLHALDLRLEALEAVAELDGVGRGLLGALERQDEVVVGVLLLRGRGRVLEREYPVLIRVQLEDQDVDVI